IIFGLLGYFMRKAGMPLVPLVLGFILGGVAETNLRSAILAQGDFYKLITRPYSALFLVVAAISLSMVLYQRYFRKSNT
ncbi:MAG TPA: Tat pathway signal protein, partial [Atribacterota bacterium]|nr:Tat pathway signal protein [Atribacterota bacterium]